MSLFITLSLVPLIKSLALRWQAVDMPGPRKVHDRPVPRIGGVAMAVGILAPILLWADMDSFGRAMVAGSIVIVGFGLLDDLRDLPYTLKLAGQVAASLIVIYAGHLEICHLGNLAPEGFRLPGVLSVPLTVFVMVGVTNAINLSDGLDGLAGGITLMSFICISFLAWIVGDHFTLTMSVAIIGAIFGFLRFNTHPAVIFMGDTGSQFLGFLAISLSLHITQKNPCFSPLLPLLLLGFPILDTLVVMTERMAYGRSPFKPDKNHFHHKLMKLGLYHTEAVFVIYLLQSALILSAIFFRFDSEWVLLLIYGAFSGIILSLFIVLERRQWRWQRMDVIDTIIKGRLRELKERCLIVSVSFRVVQFGVPLLLAVTCLLGKGIPGYFAAISGVLALLLVGIWRLRPGFSPLMMRGCLYLVMPFLVYLAQAGASDLPDPFRYLYYLSFGWMMVFLVLTLKFTRRRNGFKTTLMDFLVLFIALGVPAITGVHIQNLNMSLLAAQIIVLLFGHEVVIGEMRGKLGAQVGLVAVSLGMVTLKYLAG